VCSFGEEIFAVSGPSSPKGRPALQKLRNPGKFLKHDAQICIKCRDYAGSFCRGLLFGTRRQKSTYHRIPDVVTMEN